MGMMRTRGEEPSRDPAIENEDRVQGLTMATKTDGRQCCRYNMCHDPPGSKAPKDLSPLCLRHFLRDRM